MVISVTGDEARSLYDGAMLPTWSPRGDRIAFSGRLPNTAGLSNIATIPSDGGPAVEVVQDEYLNWNPLWSPDGGYLYFVSDRGGSMNIWRIAVNEISGVPRGEPQPITSPASFATHLSISADGDRLAYSAVLGTQNIEKLQLDPATGEALGDPVPVTTGSRFWANPDPSPDGEWVVFYSQGEPEGDLYIGKSDGSGVLRQLTNDRAIDRVPMWSPDGDRIAMFSDRGGVLQAWTIRVDGSGLQQVTRVPSSVSTWSPDGLQLAVALGGVEFTPGSPSAAIFNPSVAEDGRTPVELPVVPAPASRFVPTSWSADGTRIVGQDGYTTPGILVYGLATGRFERLVEFGEWPVWLPDSRRILFVARGREFHVLDTATKETKRVYTVARDRLGPPRLTRDGSEAYFSRRSTAADVWLATLQ